MWYNLRGWEEYAGLRACIANRSLVGFGLGVAAPVGAGAVFIFHAAVE